MKVGDKFKFGSDSYEVDRIEEIGEEMANSRAKLLETGKEPRTYYASLVLKSGKKSVRGGMFFRFESGGFIKVL